VNIRQSSIHFEGVNFFGDTVYTTADKLLHWRCLFI